MTDSEAPRRFYRIVKTDPPALRDFLSHAARGRPLPGGGDPEIARLWDGISVYASEAQARRHARASPVLGSFLAELVIPTDSSIRAERTTPSRGHYTLWGDPVQLLACTVRVVPVRRQATENDR